MFAVAMAVGCKAQPGSQAASDPSFNRHIEVVVRSEFNVPPDVSVVVGTRKPSQFSGYDTLPVTLSRDSTNKVVNFLISSDGKTLARLDTFDLAKDPMSAINVAGRPVRGNPDAKITIVSYDDLECPYCARMHQTLFPAVLNRYKDKVRVIYKDDPLVEIHPWAMRAAIDANCLATANADVYWAYVDYIHSHGEEINGEDRNLAKSNDALNRIARQQATVAKFSPAQLTQLDACIAKQDQTPILASAKEAESLGVEGTPALFIDGERISGALPDTSLWMVIDRALRAHGIEPPQAAAPAATPASK